MNIHGACSSMMSHLYLIKSSALRDIKSVIPAIGKRDLTVAVGWICTSQLSLMVGLVSVLINYISTQLSLHSKVNKMILLTDPIWDFVIIISHKRYNTY